MKCFFFFISHGLITAHHDSPTALEGERQLFWHCSIVKSFNDLLGSRRIRRTSNESFVDIYTTSQSPCPDPERAPPRP